MGKLNVPVLDYTGEASTASLPIADGEVDLNITELFDAVNGVTIGAIGQSQHVIAAAKDSGPGGNAGVKTAQREVRWLCRYHDAVNLKKRSLQIPCADFNLLATNSDLMDLAAGAGLAFKTAFDARVVDPETGNAVVLDSAELVGRR